MNLQTDSNGNLKVAGNLRQTASRIDLNGPEASAASQPIVNQLAGNTSTVQSIAGRVPEAEPWAGHLDVSTLSGGAEGVGGGSGSAYYNVAPTNYGSSGDFYIDQFPQQELPTDGLVNWAPQANRAVDPKLLNIVLEIAQRFGRPLTITSGYRDPGYNASVGGAKKSQHMKRKAVDISGAGMNQSDRLNIIGIASSLGIIGIGVYEGGSLHFDNRDGARAGWGSDYTNASVPSYARAAIDRHISGGYPPPAPLADPPPTVDPANAPVEEGDYAPGDVDLTGFSPATQKKIQELEADPEWSAEMDRMQAKHGFDRTQMYQIIQGESSFNPQAKNSSGATGLFQIMPDSAREIGTSTTAISRQTPVQQLRTYDRYLDRWDYNSDYHLGVMQAAPAYAGRQNPNSVVYNVGSSQWQQNPGWRAGGNGPVTIRSISDYYNRRN